MAFRRSPSRKSWRHCIRYTKYSYNRLDLSNRQHTTSSFTPAWFTINMGTGIISVLAGRFHFGQGTVTLEVLLLVFFFINLALFVVFAFVSVTRFCLYPEVRRATFHVAERHRVDRLAQLFTKMLLDPSEALFLGAVPVGVATLIDGALIMNQTYSFGGRGFTYSLWGFWWFALALSYLTAFGMIYILYGPILAHFELLYPD